MWHSLRYFRYSGLVIYMSKLPAPSISMPCDYRILQSPTKGQVKLVLYETARWSHKSMIICAFFLSRRIREDRCEAKRVTEFRV